ncbi:MAG: transglutaminase-like domain-containing protein [bacterium]
MISLPRRFLPALLLALAPVSAIFAQEAASALESWDAVFIGGKRVGSIQTKVTPLDDKGKRYIRVEVTTTLTFKRLNDNVTVRQRFGTIETPEGEVLRLDTRSNTGGGDIRTSGDVNDQGQLVLTLEGQGRSTTETVAWGKDVRGPYAVEQSLARSPVKTGEERTLKSYVPDLNKVISIKLMVRSKEPVELGGGAKRELMRIDSLVTGPDGKRIPELDTTYWADEGGQVLKSFTDAFGGYVTYRTTRESASAPIVAERLDLLATSIIKTGTKIKSSETVRAASYQLSSGDLTLKDVIPDDIRQQMVPAADGKTGTLTITTQDRQSGPQGPEKVADEFLAASALVNADDSRIQDVTRAATRGIDDPWDKVVAINNWVSRNLRRKNFEVAFAPASMVVRTLSGDCTEHSVLLAAMCRAAGIPAKTAVGLVYVDSLGGFGFHMWNEVYINRRWVAIDATFRQSEVDATHIKLGDSSLSTVAPYESFMSVVRVFGRLKIEPVNTQ